LFVHSAFSVSLAQRFGVVHATLPLHRLSNSASRATEAACSFFYEAKLNKTSVFI